jgi:methyl-accepting chemotaxis protein
LNQHSIRRRLIFLLTIPLASLLYFGSSKISQRRDEAQGMRQMHGRVEIAVAAGQLLHHTQRERGLSAGFLGSRGDAGFRQKLAHERLETDAAAGRFTAAVSDFGTEALGGGAAQAYEQMGRLLAEITSRRAGVDGLAATGAEVVRFYSDLNERILAMVAEIARQSSSTEVLELATAYVGFMRAKEAAGIERAVLSNSFGAGAFAPGMYARLLKLVALQDEHLASFRLHGGPEMWHGFERAMTGAFVDATRAMRDLAIASNGGVLTGVDAKLWFDRQTEKIDAMAKVEADVAAGILARAGALESDARRAFMASVAGVVAVLFVTLLFAGLVVRSIVRPLGRAVEILGRVAAGDFTRRLHVAGKDELGQMAASLNHAVDAIHRALGEVREVSNTVAGAAGELSAVTEQIADGAQRQASSLEETAASLEEITATVQQTSAHALEASELAVGSRDCAVRGGQVVAQMVTAMGEIDRSSKQIAEIIGAIDEIAFQTNLLALNAAVEAARAGEKGRGFAVVAEEVRNLAQRCSSAAREIKKLIHDSVGKVEAGSALVQQSGRVLEEIVASVGGVTDIVAAIAVSSKEQATGIEQISKAVSEMDHVTQTNAAQNEELSGTSASMADQARELRALVGRFRLSEGDADLADAQCEQDAPARAHGRLPGGRRRSPALSLAA